MRGIAGSSASRLDVIWSRMAQLFSLGVIAALWFFCDVFQKLYG
jgi:hypothetical protein